MSSPITWDYDYVNWLAKFCMVSIAADQYIISFYFNLHFFRRRQNIVCQSLLDCHVD